MVEAGKYYLDTIWWVYFANEDSLLNRQRDMHLQNNKAASEKAFPTNFLTSAATVENAETVAPTNFTSVIVAD
jgi:hypothetical protein